MKLKQEFQLEGTFQSLPCGNPQQNVHLQHNILYLYVQVINAPPIIKYISPLLLL